MTLIASQIIRTNLLQSGKCVTFGAAERLELRQNRTMQQPVDNFLVTNEVSRGRLVNGKKEFAKNQFSQIMIICLALI